MAVLVGYAGIAGIDFVGQDGYEATDILWRKTKAFEVFLAEQDGQAVGNHRLEYLWSNVPYIGLIRVLKPFSATRDWSSAAVSCGGSLAQEGSRRTVQIIGSG